MPAIVAAAKKFGIEVSAQHAAGQPLELRASAAESTNLSTASDYNPAPSGLTCPQCGAGNHGGAKFCSQCAHSFADGHVGGDVGERDGGRRQRYSRRGDPVLGGPEDGAPAA